MTVFGICFLLIAVVLSTKSTKYLFGFVIISCIFQSASIINIGGKGLPPYIIAELFLLLKIVFSKKNICRTTSNSFLNSFFLFVVIALSVTLFMPYIFEGIKVTIPGGKTSDETLANMQMLDRLSFSSRNIIQMSFLLMNAITLYLFYKYREEIPERFLTHLYLWSVSIVLIIGFWGFLNKVTNFPFPNDFFYSNIGYKQHAQTTTEFGVYRLNSTFTEPSYAGGFLSASFWGIYYAYKKYRFICVLLLLAIFLNLSSTGIVTFVFGCFILACSSLKRMIKTISFILFLSFVIYYTEYWEYFDLMLFGKMDTLSGMARSNSTLMSLEILSKINYVGLGLGSHRDFSFLCNLAVSTGLIGCFVFIYSIFLLQKYNYRCKTYNSLSSFLYHWGILLWLALIIALPDLSYSVLWMWVFSCVSQYNKDLNYEYRV